MCLDCWSRHRWQIKNPWTLNLEDELIPPFSILHHKVMVNLFLIILLWGSSSSSLFKIFRLLTKTPRRSMFCRLVLNVHSLSCPPGGDSCSHIYRPRGWGTLGSYCTFSAWASRDFKLLVTFFNSSSRSPDLLSEADGTERAGGTKRDLKGRKSRPWLKGGFQSL